MEWLQRIRKRFKRKRKKPQIVWGTDSRGKKQAADKNTSGEEGAAPRASRVLSLGFTFLILGMVTLLYFTYDMPSLDRLNAAKKGPSITVKASNGQIIGSVGDVYGEYLPFDKIPKPLVQAVLATEDRNFFHHFGIDPWGIARAMWVNMRAGKLVQGGSTITQQLAKNVYLSPDRTLRRKIQETLLAFWLEMRFSKREILAMYLNRVYLGSGNFGVDAASRRYFGKSARDVSLPEAAFLAGLLKAPSRYSPNANTQLAHKRASQVLANMVDADMITEKQAALAKTQFPTLLNYSGRGGPGTMYFVDWVADSLPEMVAQTEGDLVVTSTLDAKAQALAEDAVKTIMDERGEKLHASQAALLSMTPDGAVRAMVGGRNYSQSQYNRTVQAHRQPGSSFKLFVYLAGLEAGYTPDTTVVDQPVSIGKWSPKNYTGDYKGEMPLREAVAQSINTVAVQVSQAAGLQNVVNMAVRLGVDSPLNPDPSIALGTNEVTLMELVRAYAHLPAMGRAVTPYAVQEIRDAKGKLLYQRQEEARPQLLSTDTVGMMTTMLNGVVTHGTGAGASIGRPAAGKTGTNADYKDAWFIGFTPDLVTGVWVGNDDPSRMKKVTGGLLPAAIWRSYMSRALAGVPAKGLYTDYSVGISHFLPWLGSGAPSAPAPMQAAPPASPVHDEGKGEDDDPDFLNILNGKILNGRVEYDYPDSKDRR